MSLTRNKYYFAFLGGAVPLLVRRIKNPSERHLIRVIAERIGEMEGTFYFYYVGGLNVPLVKADMETSLFLSKLNNIFKQSLGLDATDELLIYYGYESKWRNQKLTENCQNNQEC